MTGHGRAGSGRPAPRCFCALALALATGACRGGAATLDAGRTAGTPRPPVRALELVGQVGGTISAMDVADGRLHAMAGPRLEVRSITGGAVSGIVGQTEVLGALGEDLVVAGDRAYVAAGRAGLLIMDVGEPAAPRLAGSLGLEGAATGVAVRDRTAYVTTTADDGTGRLAMVDVTDARAPRQLAVASDPAAMGGIVLADRAGGIGRLVYVATELGRYDGGTSGLAVYDLDGPPAPALLGRLEVPHEVATATAGARHYGIAASGPTVFFTTEQALAVADVTDPTHPILLGQVPAAQLSMRGTNMLVAGDAVYVTSDEPELVVIDVSNPRDPRHTSSHGGPNRAFDIAALGGMLFVADYSARGVSVYDARERPLAPATVAQQDLRGWATALFAADGHLYAGNEPGGIEIYDVRDRSQPRLAAATPGGDATRAVAASGPRLFAARVSYSATFGGGVEAYDLADPAGPRRIGATAAGCSPVAIGASGDRVFVAGNGEMGDSLAIFDFGDPAHPREVGRETLHGNMHGASIAGGLAALAVDNGIWVLDLTVAPSPRWMSRVPCADAAAVAVAGELVYCLEHGRRLSVDTIVDPTSPRELWHAPIPGDSGPAALAVAADYAVAAKGRTISLVDATEPGATAVVASTELPAPVMALALDGDTAFVSCGDAGLWAFAVRRGVAPAPRD